MNQQDTANPNAPEKLPKPVGTKMKVKDGLSKLPAKITERWRTDPKMQKCCRDITENELEFFDIDNNGEPDLVVMTCDKCGRKQRWIAAAGRPANA